MLKENDLFLATLEQMKEIMSSPELSSRAQNAFLTEIVSELYKLIDEYADLVQPKMGQIDRDSRAHDLLIQLREKLTLVEEYGSKNLQKFEFVSKITPKA